MSEAMSYRKLGKPGGPPVLLVHGWMVSGKVWNRLAPLLAGHQLFVPDLRGSGASPAGPDALSLHDYLHDLVDLCETLELSDCHLLGHSMGGQLAMLLAAASPARFRSLTVMNAVPVDGLPLPDEIQALFRNCGERRADLGQILDMACPGLEAEAREQLLDDAAGISASVIGRGFDAWMAGLPGTDLSPATMPATVIATDDPFLPPEFLATAVAARLPNARLRHLPGCGHYPQLELPRELSVLLEEIWQ